MCVVKCASVCVCVAVSIAQKKHKKSVEKTPLDSYIVTAQALTMEAIEKLVAYFRASLLIYEIFQLVCDLIS